MRISDWSSDVCSSDLFGFSSRLLTLPRPRHRGHPSAPCRHRLLRVRGRPCRRRPCGPAPSARYPCTSDCAAHARRSGDPCNYCRKRRRRGWARSEEHTSELQSLMRISYAVFCLKKKKNKQEETTTTQEKRK